MGLIDAVTRTSFEERDGGWIFYPYGEKAWVQGCQVRDEPAS